MAKHINMNEAAALIKDGMTIMVGGFLGCGSPHGLIGKIVEMNVQDLTIITTDTAYVDKGVGRLVANNQVKKVIASHIGTNKETGRQMTEGIIEVEIKVKVLHYTLICNRQRYKPGVIGHKKGSQNGKWNVG